MSYDRAIVDAIKVPQNLLWQNLPPTHNLSDAATVLRCRELVRSPAVRSVERSADTLLAFALRAVERVVPTARSSLDRPNIADTLLWPQKSSAKCITTRAATALGPSCVSPPPRLKGEHSRWQEFGRIPGNPCGISNRYFATTFLSSSPSLSGRVGVKRFQTAPSI
jgi:hypothetical protein